MSKDDDLQRIVLGNTPEGRILARVLDRLTALEDAQAKTQSTIDRDFRAHTVEQLRLRDRIERVERFIATLGDVLQPSAIDPPYFDSEHAAHLDAFRYLGRAIRQDLAEMDRQRQPKEPP